MTPTACTRARLFLGVEDAHGRAICRCVDGARKAVREQVMYGADWIKYYSDGRVRFDADGRLHSRVIFTDEEARAIVDESHGWRRKLPPRHRSDGIAAALRAGVDTIEHAMSYRRTDGRNGAKGSVLGANNHRRPEPGGGQHGRVLEEDFHLQRENFSKAIQKRVKIAWARTQAGSTGKK